jgi:hypothetical protein
MQKNTKKTKNKRQKTHYFVEKNKKTFNLTEKANQNQLYF